MIRPPPATDPMPVHGMGEELVEPDWPPLTDDEVSAVLDKFSPDAQSALRTSATVTWRSPRPWSAAALVERAGEKVFVKRHDRRVRSPASLHTEHAFAYHLAARGVIVPRPWRTPEGRGTVTAGTSVYEVHEAAPGVDLYRDAMSWTPYRSLGHARAAGQALARLHRAASDFTLKPRAQGVLMASCQIVTAADPIAAVEDLAIRRPGLGNYLNGRPWRDDMARHHLPAIERAAARLKRIPRQWGHGDWHPSNLTWTSAGPDAEVAAVLDLGLANRTFAVHDVATAVERSTVSWLDLSTTGSARPDLDALDALLDGYEAVKPLAGADMECLADLMPVVHVELALSEIEYFSAVVDSPGNADLAYDSFLVGHTRWFESPGGDELLGRIRDRRH